jgi:hypothetical protein
LAARCLPGRSPHKWLYDLEKGEDNGPRIGWKASQMNSH